MEERERKIAREYFERVLRRIEGRDDDVAKGGK